jgi:hypothetical protein
MANPGSLNKYGYVQGDPVNRLDPTGRNAEAPAAYCGYDGDGDVCYDEPDDGGGGGNGGVDPSVAGNNCTPSNLAGCPSLLVSTTVTAAGYQGSGDGTVYSFSTTVTASSTTALATTMPIQPIPLPGPTTLPPISIPDPFPVVTTILQTATNVLAGLPGVVLGIVAFATPTTGNDTLSRDPTHSEDCKEQWAWAVNYCTTNPSARKLPGGGLASVMACAAGYVSEACGGNKVIGR